VCTHFSTLSFEYLTITDPVLEYNRQSAIIKRGKVNNNRRTVLQTNNFSILFFHYQTWINRCWNQTTGWVPTRVQWQWGSGRVPRLCALRRASRPQDTFGRKMVSGGESVAFWKTCCGSCARFLAVNYFARVQILQTFGHQQCRSHKCARGNLLKPTHNQWWTTAMRYQLQIVWFSLRVLGT